jgi:hypothetical protein
MKKITEMVAWIIGKIFSLFFGLYFKAIVKIAKITGVHW